MGNGKLFPVIEFFLFAAIPLLDWPEIADDTGIDLAGLFYCAAWTFKMFSRQITMDWTN